MGYHRLPFSGASASKACFHNGYYSVTQNLVIATMVIDMIRVTIFGTQKTTGD